MPRSTRLVGVALSALAFGAPDFARADDRKALEARRGWGVEAANSSAKVFGVLGTQ